MKTFNKLSSFGAALLLATSAGSVYADDSDITQTRSQERTRTEFNLQVPDSDFGQSRNREEHTLLNQDQNQHQYQYKYMNKQQNNVSGSATSSMNRYMQNSATSGSMSRQNSASRSMGGSRR